jgi:hypothetical protein
MANELQDPSVIQTDFLLDSQGNLEILVQRIKGLYGSRCETREDFQQSTYMLGEINAIIS